MLLKYNNIQLNIMLLFVRSLIPNSPFGIGKVAIQSTSRGNRIIRHTMDNKVENRWIKNIDYRIIVSQAVQFLLDNKRERKRYCYR